QRKPEQQHEADEKAVERRPRRRRRQLRPDQAGERGADAELRAIANRRAERAGEEREQSELAGVKPDERALRRAEAAHHGAAAEMALDEAAGTGADGDA